MPATPVGLGNPLCRWLCRYLCRYLCRCLGDGRSVQLRRTAHGCQRCGSGMQRAPPGSRGQRCGSGQRSATDTSHGQRTAHGCQRCGSGMQGSADACAADTIGRSGVTAGGRHRARAGRWLRVARGWRGQQGGCAFGRRQRPDASTQRLDAGACRGAPALLPPPSASRPQPAPRTCPVPTASRDP